MQNVIMRIYLIIIILLLLSCNQQANKNVDFKLTGRVKNLNGIEVTLRQHEKILSKTIIKNDTFSVAVKLVDRQLYTIVFSSFKPYFHKGFMFTGGGAYIKNVFVEAGSSYLMTAYTADNISNVKSEIITDSKIHKEFEEFDRMCKKRYRDAKNHLAQLELKRDLALKQGNDKAYTDYTDSIRLNEQELSRQRNKTMHAFTLKNPKSIVSIYLLSEATDIKKNLGFYQHLNKQLNEAYSNHPYTILFRKKLQAAEKMKSGNVNLSFTAKNLIGSSLNLKDFSKSKLIVFDFWATWCAPCMKEIPASLRLEKEFSHQEVSYVFVSYDFNENHWKKNSASLGLTNSFILDDKNKQILNDNLDIATIPRYVITNNKGDVLVSDAPSPSSPELRKLIRGLLNTN